MRTHELVLKWIEKQLSDGSLALGGRLPAERSLAEQLAVSRTSVREAIRILEAMGVVRAGVGSGKDAGTLVIADPTAALGSALRLHVATQHLPVADIVETRILLESWAAAHAAPGAPSLDEAERLLSKMEASGTDAGQTGGGGTDASGTEVRATESWQREGAGHQMGASAVDRFLALDVRFHLALADAAGNAVVSAMMGSLRESIEGYASELTVNLPDWESTAARLRAEHRAILDAVRNNDGVRAAGLVAAHIEGFYREAGLGIPPRAPGTPSGAPGNSPR